MADYTTAKDLGIAQEEEKLAVEALARQQSQGVVGQWELVEASTPAAPSTSALPQKRPHQEEDEEGADYRVRRRKLAEGLGEIYDPGKITLVPKRNEKWVDITTEIVETTQTQPSPITWSKKRWRMAGTEDTGGSDEEKQPATVPEEEVKVDEPAPPSMTDEQSNEAPPPPEPTDVVVEPAPVKGMFKKRKAPAQAVGAKKGMRKQL
jgi:WW domain-binding protein 4